MITENDLIELLKMGFANADVAVLDLNGMQDHYRVYVSSDAFEGKTTLQRHQMVYRILKPAYSDGRLHAAEITTDTPAVEAVE